MSPQIGCGDAEPFLGQGVRKGMVTAAVLAKPMDDDE